ncbi:MAG: MotA/TolQ/ExbB proton channel family protein [Firmicutes bacterium]|nr:MotA/TolQ/ExbB proton channel family protein [Bacillota bacterium]
MIELFNKGGILMYPLLLCSVLALAVIIERIYYFIIIRDDLDEVMDRVESSLKQGRVLEAMQVARRARGPVATVLAAAIAHKGEPRQVIEDYVKRAGNVELYKLERGLPLLETVIMVSPLLGLLGTVLGIMQSFNVMGALRGVNDPAVLAPGIAEALITTAAGLSIAIPASMMHAFFVRKVDKYVLEMNNRAVDIVNLLSERGED